MAKNQRSIDGFILQRRDPESGRDVQRVFMDSNQAPRKPKNIEVKSAPAAKTSAPALQKSEKMLPNSQPAEDISEDLQDSLKNLGLDKLDEETPMEEENSGKKSRRQRKADKKAAKRGKKAGKKSGKRWPVKRIVKWFFIFLIALALAVGGYLLVKTLITGGKVFEGNVLDALTSKSRLAEDENGRTNIVIFGTSGYTIDGENWDGGSLTDSIMVLSVNQDKHDAYMISLPRDLYVKHTCKNWLGTTSGKLNETYQCGFVDNNDSEEAGASALRSTAGDILGLDVQYYVHADWAALVQMVDAVGGVDVTVEGSGGNGIYDYETKLKLAEGPAHLDGETALAFARARGSGGGYGLAGGNFDREKNQQKVLAALQKKALSAGTLANPVAVNSILDSIGDHLRTNFKSSEVQTLIDLAKNIHSDNIISLPLVGRTDGGPDLFKNDNISGASVVVPMLGQYNYSDIKVYVAQNLTSDPLVKENALIDVLNGSGEVGLAQRKADELKEAGFRVGQTANAPENIAESIKIYQLNPDKTASAAALQEQFGVQLVAESLTGYTTEADFVIVFGPSE